jgi:hypothetical protein
MPKEIDRARVRGIEARLNSRRVSDGAFSIFGRLRPEAIGPMARAIAASHPASHLDEDDLHRCAVLFIGKNPAAARSHAENTAFLNRRRMNDQAKVVVRDVTTALLKGLSPTDRLEYANTGSLPDKYILKGPQDV